jgi:hypothetical protein
MVLIITKRKEARAERYQCENSEIKSEVLGSMRRDIGHIEFDARRNGYNGTDNGIPLG